MSNRRDMGVWGTGIFSDDIAADVRDEYRDYLADGMDGPSATEKLLEQFGAEVDDPDAGPPFWLSLAATQWRLGRLEERVRERALRIIDDGTDLARFSEKTRLRNARQRVLQKLRAQLCTQQRAPVKVRPDVPLECDWVPGEVIGFRRDSGEWIALHVQGVVAERKSRYPVVGVLDIPFDQVEAADESTPLRRLQMKGPRWGPCPDCFHVIGLKRRDLNSERISRIGKTIAPVVEVNGVVVGGVALPWKGLDEYLSRFLK